MTPGSRPRGPHRPRREERIPVRTRIPEDDAPADAGPASTSRELALCGWNCVAAAFARRPEAVTRLFFEERQAPRTGEWCRALAASRRVYRMVPGEELARIADTVHHGGIVAIVSERQVPVATDADAARLAASGSAVLALDGVGNPHNLGLLARTAAFFGFRALLVGARPGETPPRFLSSAAYRVAEGGLEHLEVLGVYKLPEFIRRNRASFLWCATDIRGGEPIEAVDVQRFQRPPALVAGNEESGVTEAVLAACERKIVIRGTNRVESLNVAAATAIALHHFAPAVRRLASPG